MKSITIHGMDDALDEEIRSKAGAEGQSLNKTIKHLLTEALGMGKSSQDRRPDFQDLFGIWSHGDVEAFNRAIEDMGRVDPQEWK